MNDEWGDPAHCDQGEECSYCHTRTEQQFHPEVSRGGRDRGGRGRRKEGGERRGEGER